MLSKKDLKEPTIPTPAWMDQRIYFHNVFAARAYKSFEAQWNHCTICPIGSSSTTLKHCLARGDIPCDILFIGEAPGRSENIIGAPFVGPAGRLLSEWLYEIRVRYEHKRSFRVAITNLLCCRPISRTGQNRVPATIEIENCSPRLQKFIEIASPRCVCFLGRVAQQERLRLEAAGASLGFVLNLYHPAYLLRIGGRQSEQARIEKEKLVTFLDGHFKIRKNKKT